MGQFLSIWNGSTKREAVLETLTFAPLIDFNGKSSTQLDQNKARLTHQQICSKAHSNHWNTPYWTTRQPPKWPS